MDGRPGRAVCSHDGAYVISFDAGRDHGDGHGLHADNRGGQTEECLDANLGYLVRNCSNPDQSVQTGSIQIDSRVDGSLSTEAATCGHWDTYLERTWQFETKIRCVAFAPAEN